MLCVSGDVSCHVSMCESCCALNLHVTFLSTVGTYVTGSGIWQRDGVRVCVCVCVGVGAVGAL